uniref:Uncharacterized protein n=1 Tax=Romanomermis culicivorax TaxID=13658 RepID=A0A915IQS8_ROMCU
MLYITHAFSKDPKLKARIDIHREQSYYKRRAQNILSSIYALKLGKDVKFHGATDKLTALLIRLLDALFDDNGERKSDPFRIPNSTE